MKKYVIISAAQFEAQPLLDLLNTHKVPFEFMACGIGAIQSARRFSELWQFCHNNHVLFLGTCGLFEGDCLNVKIGDLIKPNRVFWLPYDVRTNDVWDLEFTNPPIIMPATVKNNDLPSADVICTSSISKTSAPIFSTQKTLVVENLELYSILPALLNSSHLDIILSISNYINSDGRADWRQNNKGCSENIARYFIHHVTHQS